jgi:hypothetical protein
MIHLELPQLMRGDASPRKNSIGGNRAFGYAPDEGNVDRPGAPKATRLSGRASEALPPTLPA